MEMLMGSDGKQNKRKRERIGAFDDSAFGPPEGKTFTKDLLTRKLLFN